MCVSHQPAHLTATDRFAERRLRNSYMPIHAITRQGTDPVLKSANVERLCCRRYEREARQRGWMRIAGLDEAGRGSLFGPVVAAAVILSPTRRIVGLDDSKKLPAERRTELAVRIHEHAIAWD